MVGRSTLLPDPILWTPSSCATATGDQKLNSTPSSNNWLFPVMGYLRPSRAALLTSPSSVGQLSRRCSVHSYHLAKRKEEKQCGFSTQSEWKKHLASSVAKTGLKIFKDPNINKFYVFQRIVFFCCFFWGEGLDFKTSQKVCYSYLLQGMNIFHIKRFLRRSFNLLLVSIKQPTKSNHRFGKS